MLLSEAFIYFMLKEPFSHSATEGKLQNPYFNFDSLPAVHAKKQHLDKKGCYRLLLLKTTQKLAIPEQIHLD